MRFVLIDRILNVQRGESLVAVKNLSLAEEYLSDHFPGFPVMPGVLMLEALTQAGAWVIRDMEDFGHSIIVLKQAKTIKGVGVIDGQEMVKGRIVLTRFNLRDRDPGLHQTDATIVEGLRDLYQTLRKGSVGARAITRLPLVEEVKTNA